jgi:hypothetical protein
MGVGLAYWQSDVNQKNRQYTEPFCTKVLVESNPDIYQDRLAIGRGFGPSEIEGRQSKTGRKAVDTNSLVASLDWAKTSIQCCSPNVDAMSKLQCIRSCLIKRLQNSVSTM